MIHASQISKASAHRHVLSDISFFLPAGSYTYLTGASGSGKTTLLEMIAGRQRPDSGRLVVNGIEMQKVESERLPFIRRTIGYVESFPSFLESHSIAENVCLPLEIAGFSRTDSSERVARIMNELGLSMLADIAMQRLTDDQRWLTACARATVYRPSLLLIDQPPTSISCATMLRIRQLADLHCSAGATVLTAAEAVEDRDHSFHIELENGRAFINEQRSAVH